MKKVQIPQNDLVEALVPDAGNVETYQILYGWIGKSTRKGYIRLYADLDMAAYLEFLESDVQLVKSMQTPENPLDGSTVWLSADAKILETGNTDSDMSADAFLMGGFSDKMAGYERDATGVIDADDVIYAAAAKSKIFPRRCGLSRPPKSRRIWKCCPFPRSTYAI